jgi:hypothetical protein
MTKKYDGLVYRHLGDLTVSMYNVKSLKGNLVLAIKIPGHDVVDNQNMNTKQSFLFPLKYTTREQLILAVLNWCNTEIMGLQLAHSTDVHILRCCNVYFEYSQSSI